MWLLQSGLILISLFLSVYTLSPIVVIHKDGPVVNVVRGSTFEIRCEVGNKRGEISVRWELYRATGTGNDTLQIAQNRLPTNEQKYGLKYEDSDKYTLIIKNVDPTDQGIYKCEVYFSRYVASKDSVDLRVIEAPRINPMNTSSDMTVLSPGTDVRLSCAAFGIPEPLIKWTRAGNGLMPGGGFVRYGKYLNITSIQPQHAGPYICSAKNDFGEDFRTINVNLNYPPIVTALEHVTSQKLGYAVHLICHVDAGGISQRVRVSWSHSGNSLTNGDRHQITTFEAAFDKTVSKLTIKQTQSSDYTGEYVCTAVNSKQESSSTTFTIDQSNTVNKQHVTSTSSHIYGTISLLLLSLLFLI